MLADQVDAVIGVDTHRDTHTAAVVRPTGAVIACTVFTTDVEGFQELLEFVEVNAPAGRLVWAVEGTRSYGVGLVRFLHRHGQQVVEVDHPKRPARRGGKSDERDAVQAAREALSRDMQSAPRADGPREGLRVLLLARDSAVAARTAAINTLKALILTAPDELRSTLRGRSAIAPSTAPPCAPAPVVPLRTTHSCSPCAAPPDAC